MNIIPYSTKKVMYHDTVSANFVQCECILIFLVLPLLINRASSIYTISSVVHLL